MTGNTITKRNIITTETRYFSSSSEDITTVSRAIRSHWMVESVHWHLDITFKEDGNLTSDKHIVFNLNILKKLALKPRVVEPSCLAYAILAPLALFFVDLHKASLPQNIR